VLAFYYQNSLLHKTLHPLFISHHTQRRYMQAGCLNWRLLFSASTVTHTHFTRCALAVLPRQLIFCIIMLRLAKTQLSPACRAISCLVSPRLSPDRHKGRDYYLLIMRMSSLPFNYYEVHNIHTLLLHPNINVLRACH
jgi:hypothetical protein